MLNWGRVTQTQCDILTMIWLMVLRGPRWVRPSHHYTTTKVTTAFQLRPVWPFSSDPCRQRDVSGRGTEAPSMLFGLRFNNPAVKKVTRSHFVPILIFDMNMSWSCTHINDLYLQDSMNCPAATWSDHRILEWISRRVRRVVQEQEHSRVRCTKNKKI